MVRQRSTAAPESSHVSAELVQAFWSFEWKMLRNECKSQSKRVADSDPELSNLCVHKVRRRFQCTRALQQRVLTEFTFVSQYFASKAWTRSGLPWLEPLNLIIPLIYSEKLFEVNLERLSSLALIPQLKTGLGLPGYVKKCPNLNYASTQLTGGMANRIVELVAH